MTTATKKWSFRHCFGIERDPDPSEFAPATREYRFRYHLRGRPELWLTDLDIKPEEKKAVDGWSNWCVTGTVEAPAAFSEKDVDELSWEAFSESAYGTIRDIMYGSDWYDGGVEPLVTTTDPEGATVSRGDLETINRHRASMGRRPIDIEAGWSSKELRDMAANIRRTGRETNPIESTKDRLLAFNPTELRRKRN